MIANIGGSSAPGSVPNIMGSGDYRTMTRKLYLVLILAIVAALSQGCGHLGFLNRGGTADESVSPVSALPDTASMAERERQLEDAVRSYINDVSGDGGEDGQLVRRKPYWFRQRVVYPDGPDAFEMSIREADSRTAPLRAEVKLDKVRYASEMHEKKDAAREDTNLYRGTGTETLTYEFRNGRWDKLGSLFVAEKLEENVNGEWVPVEESVEEQLMAEQPSRGFLRRAWSGITGR